MKALRTVVTIGAALLLCTVVLAAAERVGPRLELAEEQFDLGKVVQGEEAVHLFEFRNAGDEVLEIQKIQTS